MGVMPGYLELPFRDPGNVPEFFANGLHDLEVMGEVVRFTLFTLRRMANGRWFKEPVLHYILPASAIMPARELVTQRLPALFRGQAQESAGSLRVN